METPPALQFAYHPAPTARLRPVCGNPLSGPTGAARRRLPPWVPVVLLCAGGGGRVLCPAGQASSPCPQTFRSRSRPPESAGLVLDEADRFCIWTTPPTNITFTLTADGAEQPHGHQRHRPLLHGPQCPDPHRHPAAGGFARGDGYRTALALVSKPSNENAAFGTFVPCEADGYAKPDEEYLDAMPTVYYRAYLRSANAAAPPSCALCDRAAQPEPVRQHQMGHRRGDLRWTSPTWCAIPNTLRTATTP